MLRETLSPIQQKSRPLLLLTRDPCCPVVRHVLVLDASCNSDETSRHREQKWYVGFSYVITINRQQQENDIQ